MTIEAIILGMYFLFLLSIMLLANNINTVANHPVTEHLVNKIRYNLRDVPRVDYKELSDEDEDEDESCPSESESEYVEEEENSILCKRRRNNSISRILDEALD